MGATFSFIVFMFILPFARSEFKCLATADWSMLIGAGVISAIAMMSMTSYLAASDHKSVGLLIILMIVAQAVITAAYQMVMDRGISTTRLIGFICAGTAIVLLNNK